MINIILGAMAGALFAAAVGISLSSTMVRHLKEDAFAFGFVLPFLGALIGGLLVAATRIL